jgi:hypothetical protein
MFGIDTGYNKKLFALGYVKKLHSLPPFTLENNDKDKNSIFKYYSVTI